MYKALQRRTIGYHQRRRNKSLYFNPTLNLPSLKSYCQPVINYISFLIVYILQFS